MAFKPFKYGHFETQIMAWGDGVYEQSVRSVTGARDGKLLRVVNPVLLG